MTTPPRTVLILRDTCAPLHYLRCVEPCAPEGWCQQTPRGERICWLGAALDRERAAGLARRVGYVVSEAAGVTARSCAPSGAVDAPPAAAGAVGACGVARASGEAWVGGYGAQGT